MKTIEWKAKGGLDMTFEEMKFQLFRENSYGYRVMFKDGLPVGYGCEADINGFASFEEKEKAVSRADDSLYDGTTPLYKAADGNLYKLLMNGSGSIKVWTRARLLDDKVARFKEIRVNCCTQQELASRTGLKVQSISRLETGERPLENATGKVLLKLADGLGVSVEELLR